MSNRPTARSELSAAARAFSLTVAAGLLVWCAALVARRLTSGSPDVWARVSAPVGIGCLALAMLVQRLAARRRWPLAISAALIVASVLIVRSTS